MPISKGRRNSQPNQGHRSVGGLGKPDQIILANWGRRVIAWFIDYMLLNILLAYYHVESLELNVIPLILLPKIPGTNLPLWSPISILVFILYWGATEGFFGRSIGQLLVNVRLTDLEGGNPTLKAAFIQSVGKAGFLPVDLLLGLAFPECRQRRQRFFNRLSKTVVVYIKAPSRYDVSGEYAKER